MHQAQYLLVEVLIGRHSHLVPAVGEAGCCHDHVWAAVDSAGQLPLGIAEVRRRRPGDPQRVDQCRIPARLAVELLRRHSRRRGVRQDRDGHGRDETAGSINIGSSKNSRAAVRDQIRAALAVTPAAQLVLVAIPEPCAAARGPAQRQGVTQARRSGPSREDPRSGCARHGGPNCQVMICRCWATVN